MTATDEQAFAQLVAQLDPQGKLLHTRPLKGGISAQVTALAMIDGAGQRQQLIVRQHGAIDRQRNPTIATAEFHLLQTLWQAGIPVPRPYYVDQQAAIFATPALVIEYIEGETEFAPTDLGAFLDQAATHLSQIHQLTATTPAYTSLKAVLPPLGPGFGTRPATLDASLQEGRIRDWLAAHGPLVPINQATVLHGDFWPGNLLWRAGQLVAVIDWEDATLGDPLADLANSRLELLWAFGESAMQHFTDAYWACHALDFTHLPYWDLCAALRPAGKLDSWGLAETTLATMRARHQWFVNQALQAALPQT